MIEELKPNWGSHISSHRADIREALLQKFGSRILGDIHDLSIPPRLRDAYVSISHAPGLGGYLFGPSWVGLDVEVTDRVTTELAKRISDTDELAASSDPASLWCAKESVFKALQFGQQPKTIGAIRLSWLTATTFILANGSAFGGVGARGEIKKMSRHTVASTIVMPCD